MSSGVSVLLATRGRPKRFDECFRSIEKTKSGEVEVLTYIDDDDASDYKIKSVVGPRVGASKRFFKLFEKAKFDNFLLIGDDQVFLTQGWDLEMLSLMPEDNIGLVHCKDNWKEVVSAILVHRKWYELTGLFPQDFEHFGLDTYIADIARLMGRLFRTEKAIIEHRHFRNGKADKDATYDHPRHSMMNQRDEERLKGYRKTRMPEDIKTLKAEIERFSQGTRVIDAERARNGDEQAKAL